jgi:hypothetical protein
MGRNAAFGRPPASERLREWWDARSKTSRQNIYLALGVVALFVAIVMAATARDKVPASRRVIAARPPQQPTTTLALPTPSTVNVGDLGATVTAADVFGLSTTTTAPAPATTSPPPARPATTVATTAPAPSTTVTNPDVIFTTVAPATTTTQPPVTTTRPTTTTTTVPPTTTLLPVPLSVPNLLAG